MLHWTPDCRRLATVARRASTCYHRCALALGVVVLSVACACHQSTCEGIGHSECDASPAHVECLFVGSERAEIEFSLLHRDLSDSTLMRRISLEYLDILDDMKRHGALESFGASPAKGGIGIGGRVGCIGPEATQVHVTFELSISLVKSDTEAVEGVFRVALRYRKIVATGLWRLESQNIDRIVRRYDE